MQNLANLKKQVMSKSCSQFGKIQNDDANPYYPLRHARPDHLRQTLDCLRENQVRLIYAFSDGPHTPDKAAAVGEVRNMLRTIDWFEVVLCERETNLGLGDPSLPALRKCWASIKCNYLSG